MTFLLWLVKLLEKLVVDIRESLEEELTEESSSEEEI